jgi:hypothetical protein
MERHAATVPAVHMQDKCSMVQLQFVGAGTGARISMGRCVGHKGMMPLVTSPHLNVKALKCTNCAGCQECRQPVSLVIPEGTGGSGCAAEVAAKAEALHAALYKSSESATAGKGYAGNAAAGVSTQISTDANTALVECAVCHRRPGDPGVPATMKLCGGCFSVRYCSADCQRKDWKLGHKFICPSLGKDLRPS